MLQTLEKEIDDVDAKIGDHWRLLDRYFLSYIFSWESIMCYILYFETMVNCFYFYMQIMNI